MLTRRKVLAGSVCLPVLALPFQRQPEQLRIDGQALQTGWKILFYDQSQMRNNGIWVVKSVTKDGATIEKVVGHAA